MPRHRRGDVVDHVVGQGETALAADGSHDAAANVIVGREKAGHHASPQSGKQVGTQIGEGVEFAVAGEDHLTALAEQRVERLLKFEEGRLLAHEELEIVDHQHVRRAAGAAKSRQATGVQRLQKGGGELLSRQADRGQARMQFAGPVAGGLHEVRLPDPARTMNHQRRHLAGPGRGEFDRRERHPVARADHEVHEPQRLPPRWVGGGHGRAGNNAQFPSRRRLRGRGCVSSTAASDLL